MLLLEGSFDEERPQRRFPTRPREAFLTVRCTALVNVALSSPAETLLVIRRARAAQITRSARLPQPSCLAHCFEERESP